MTTFTDKELIKEIKERIDRLDVRDDIERRAYEIALALLETEPVERVNADQMRRVCLGTNFYSDKYGAMAKEVNTRSGRTAPSEPIVSDDGRAQFEALIRFHAGDKNHEALLQRANEGMNYRAPNVDLAWTFWKYSRDHLIQNPKMSVQIAPEAIGNAIEYIRSIAFHINEDDYNGKHIAAFMRQALVCLEGDSCYTSHSSGNNDQSLIFDKQIQELTMLIKRLAHSLKCVDKSSKLPDKAIEYLNQNGLISVEDVLR